VWVLFAVRMDVCSEFQMGAVLDIKFCVEEENETSGITILWLWPRVIDCGMCCKYITPTLRALYCLDDPLNFI